MDDFDSWLSGRQAPADEGQLPAGTEIGGYRIVARLGRGGFAEVYKAEDGRGGAAAVKILHRLDDKSRMRFARESEILSQIRHPNIPRLLGFGSFGESPYMVTELLRSGELPKEDHRVATFLRQLISAVAELHRCGYIHRDIKPANILFREDGTPVLIDFGLVCPISVVEREKEALSMEGGNQVAVGTVGYSAPEQFSGQGAGPEADVHAVGVLIYACFEGNMPKSWCSIYLAATASNPRSRYPSMTALEQAINRRHRGWLVRLGLVLAVGLALTALAFSARWVESNSIPDYVYWEDCFPADDDDATNCVQQVEVRLWYEVQGVDKYAEELLDFLHDECGQRFQEQLEDRFNSVQMRLVCSDRQEMRREFTKVVREALAERNEDESVKWDIAIKDIGVELR